MKSNWQKVQLRNVLKVNQHVVDSSFKYSRIKYIDIASVENREVKSLQELELSEAPSRARRVVHNNSILISTVRPNLRHYVFIKNAAPNLVASTGFAVINDIPEVSDAKFLYYLLTSEVFTNYLVKIAESQTSAYPAFNPNIIENKFVEIPDLPTQNFIASILSSYDDLIENNEKRIKILEEMAQRLYTEWFVNFKFPGNEKVRMVDSGTDYGMIPEGWEVKKISDIGKVITGKTPSKRRDEYYSNEIMFIKTPDFENHLFIQSTNEMLSHAGAATQKDKILPERTVMISTIGTIGKVAITKTFSTTNQQINSVVLDEPDDYIFFYFFARNLKSKLEGLGSNGATMGNVSKSKFESISILLPNKELRQRFYQLTRHAFNLIENLEAKQASVIGARDLLVENLVTGKRLLSNGNQKN